MNAMRFKIRNVLKELEAHIHPTRPDSDIRGKSEWKQYADGTYRFKVSVRNISLPDNSQIDLMLNDVRIMQLTLIHNKAKIDRESQTRMEIPNIHAGQVLQVKFGEMVLAEGVYVEE